MSTNSKFAQVEQSSASKPPFLTAGELTPEVLCTWEMGCTQFFLHKEVKDVEMVKKVAWGMQEPVMQDWYSNNQARLDALTFKDYMAEVCSYWLPSGWADSVRRKMLASMQGQQPFHEWAVNFQGQNTLLRGTLSHLKDDSILYHLEAHMNSDLAADYQAENITETKLCKWIEKVWLLDERCLRYVVQQKDTMEAALRAEHARSAGGKKLTVGTCFNSKAGQMTNNASSASKPFTCLPSLTEDECQLLCDNDGCFKCREPFAGHGSATCKKGFPNGATYKTLMAVLIVSKRAKKDKGIIAAVEAEESDTVAVVMPSTVLEGSDSGEECVAPLQTPHLRWECFVDRPAVFSPLNVSALIDHGSSLVLIGEGLVNKLGLHCRKLPKPILVSLALSQDKSCILLHFVKLSCSSLDQAYKFRTVRAIITPNLCTPLLLGGPFLEHNCIVVDHELCTCIVKDANYNLLQHTVPKPTTEHLKHVSASGPDLFWMKHDVVQELKHVLPELKGIVDAECEDVKGINIVATISSTIARLEYQGELKACDA
ncbi:uncharacterized protein HD556DRAFT_1451069 [Suillus plorans]|uniref:Uncharacterized protein n=1 Tax=Suillus plorans TaxID=116603 RepID=A0A9P7AA29_9AGAM|nr:uncharacterized protein HD556DRAFT_1451069 [Suillus plorans]KAG1785106.1 hypothetical protein HD556DRAFT_1451069 [Suillus plorans]